MHEDDELMEGQLVRALLAPAAAHELAGEEVVLTAFRQAVAGGGRRRRTMRVATGASALVLAMAVTGGVAAAFPDTLPEPLQNAVHSVLGPVGVPAAPQAARPHRPRAVVASPHRPRPQRPSPAAVPRAVVPLRPSPGSSAVAPPGAARPSPVPSPTPSATPGPQPPPTLSVAASRRVVPVHQGLEMRGAVSRNGRGLADKVVYAAVYDAGGSAWRRVASGRTAADGTVSLHIGPLVRNGRVRLTSQGVASSPISFTVVPRLSVTLTRTSAGDRYVVDVGADGGEPGDTATLQRYDGGNWVDVASHALSSEARTRYVIPAPSADPVGYRVRLAATRAHGPSGVRFTAQP
jgi:hypothetical protein